MGRTQKELGRYIRAAFRWHWNLLAVGAGVALSLLAALTSLGAGLSVLAFVGAAELAYLGLTATSRGFQAAVDGRDRATQLSANTTPQTDYLARLRDQLPADLWRRFETLRDRCIHLGELARQFQGSGSGATQSSIVSDMHGDSLDRLLWMFLRMLASRSALDKFLMGTSREGMVRDVGATEKALQEARTAKRSDKLIAALEDKLKTLRERLENLDRARDNRELISVEIDRIEQKVSAVGEFALSAHEAGDLEPQVDGIAAGVAATEDALRDLPVIPDFFMDQPPAILRQAAPPTPMRQ